MFKKPFTVTGLAGKQITAHDNIRIPMLMEAGINTEINLHVVDWHGNFDALLGSEDLKNMNAKIDYETQTLQMGQMTIPFSYQYTSNKIDPIRMSVTNKIKIPVTIESGDVLIPEVNLTEYTTIPESIATASKGFCTVPVINNRKIVINFLERLPVEPICNFQLSEPPNLDGRPPIQNLIRIDHLNSEERPRIVQLCKKFHDVFYYENCDLSFSNTVKHHIRTTDESPVYVKSYRHPYFMRDEIQRHVQKLLEGKIIRPSISPYSAPVWVVPKKADASGVKKYRMVVDFRQLNAKTIEDKYPLPRIEEILENLGKCAYYSTLDLAQGFHQIEMDPQSIEKTAFNVNNGHYEYLRMPFGLKNAPSTFQRTMEEVLKEYLHRFCFVYIDDVVVFSKSLEEHLQHLTLIFKKFRLYNLKVQLDKSEFLRKEVPFLGHIVTPDGIRPNPDKVKAVESYPIPKTPKEIKSFLGLIGYYRRFIADFAKIVSPFTKCLKKNAKIDINDTDYVEAFYTCKELLANAPILAYPDFSKRFCLTTDASNIALAGVLSQANRPIAYYSRTLNQAERNYSTIERELLSIVECTKHFRPYLFGQRFLIETDHAPLVWLDRLKEPNSRLIRWKTKLKEFDYEIKHKKGKENFVADALSRIEINMNEDDETNSLFPNIDEIPLITEEDILSQLPAHQPVQLTEIDLDRITRPNDATLTQEEQRVVQELMPASREPDEDDDQNTIHSAHGDGGMGIPISERPVNIFPNRIIISIGEHYKRRIVRPFNRNTHIIHVNQNKIKEELMQVIQDTLLPDKTYCVYFKDEQLKGPFLEIFRNTFRQSMKIFISNKYYADIVEPDTQKEIIYNYHSENHNGIIETTNHIKQQFYWPNIKEMVTSIINKCEECLKSKYERQPYKLKFTGPLLAQRPFDTIHIDTFSFQNSKFLTIVDLFSKYAQGYLIKDGTGLTVLNKLREFFAHHNVPKRIVCDEGKEFKNKVFAEFCKLNKIELHYTTVNNPESNSPIERLHSTLVEKLRILRLKTPNEPPCNHMTTAIQIYNQAIHSSTGFSPFHLLYGPYDRVIDFDRHLTVYEQYNEKRKQEILPFYDEVYTKTKEKANKILEKRNQNREDPPELPEGEDVFIERNRPRKTDPPFERIRVDTQEGGKVKGITQKARVTTAHLRKAKRLRKVPEKPNPLDNEPQQEPSGPLTIPELPCSQEAADPGGADSPQPGPSGLQG